MSFMQKQVTVKQSWWQVETSIGTEIVPVDLVSLEPADSDAFADYCEGRVESWELIEGYGARLSAPGYMDCTEWTVFDTPEEAEAYLEEMYGDESDEESEDPMNVWPTVQAAQNLIITRRFWVTRIAPTCKTRTLSGNISKRRQSLRIDVRTHSCVGEAQAQSNAEEFGRRKLKADKVFVSRIDITSAKPHYSIGPRK